MDTNTLLVIMAVFVAVSALALLVQAGMLYGLYKAARGLQQNAERLMPKIESLVDASRVTVEQSRAQIVDITSKTSEILDTTRKQLERVDGVMEEAAARARVQMDRAEMVLDDTMSRAQETVKLVQGGIIKPLKEIQSVAIGLRAAFQYLARGSRPHPANVTADEEMFI